MIDYTKNEPTLLENSNFIHKLKSSLFVKFNQAREGIHVSDINLCARETVFRRLNPKQLTNRDLNVFTSGRAIHDAIQTLAEYYKEYTIEKEINFNPLENKWTKDIDGADLITIKAHIDIYDSVNNIPIEAKTVRKKNLGTYDKSTKKYSDEKAKPFNVEQLQMYMALTDSDIGYLVYQLLLNFDDTPISEDKTSPFVIFEVKMTNNERVAMLRDMVYKAVNLHKGIEEKNPALTSHIADDINKNWKCQYCKYFNLCYDMRVEAGEIKGIKKVAS